MLLENKTGLVGSDACLPHYFGQGSRASDILNQLPNLPLRGGWGKTAEYRQSEKAISNSWLTEFSHSMFLIILLFTWFFSSKFTSI